MSKSDNPFEIFLGVQTDAENPDFAKVLDLDPSQASVEEIKMACDKVIAKVRSQKPGDKNKEWAWLIDRLKKAKDSLVNRANSKASGKASDPPKTSATKRKNESSSSNVNTYAPPPLGNTPKPSESKKSNAAKSNTTKTNEPTSSPPTSNKPSKARSNAAEKSPSKKSSATSNPPVSDRKKNPAKTAETNEAKEQSKPNVALPPVLGKTKSANKDEKSKAESKSQKKTAATKPEPKETGKEAKAGEPDAFTLDAPNQKDSFDSDTQFSASTFNSSAANAQTIDPMAPVGDPTANWDSFDIGQIDKYGMIATAVASPTATQTATQSSPATESEKEMMPVRDKTYYGESYRKKSKVGVMIGGTLLAMLIVGGISYGIIFGFNPPGGDAVAKGDEEEKSKSNSEDVPPKKETGSDADNNKEDENQKVSGDENQKQPADDETPEKTDDSEMPNKTGTDSDMKKDEKAEPEKSDTDQTPPKKDDNDDPKKSPNDAEMKKKEPEPAKPKNSDIAELARLLTEIRSKLNDRNFVDSSRLLSKAQQLPILPDHKLLLDRLVQINDLYQKFWNTVVEGCGKLKALDEIKFSDTNIVKVVESSEEKIVYRALGQRFEKEPRELQIGLAMKIAEKEMDMQSAEGRMIKGAVFAIDAINNSDRADEARSIWEDAKLVGGETDELILFLDDKYDGLLTSVITREKVPTEEDVAKAQERFREKYADSLKTAARNQKAATEFANQLLKDVPTLDDVADRHANFVAAIFYAGKHGEVELVLTALSDMNKWFNIKLEEETLDALTKVNKNRLKPEQKREIARTAFEYMDRAKAATNQELELKFAELALAAARGTRDQKLVQTATREVQRVKASMESNN